MGRLAVKPSKKASGLPDFWVSTCFNHSCWLKSKTWHPFRITLRPNLKVFASNWTVFSCFFGMPSAGTGLLWNGIQDFGSRWNYDSTGESDYGNEISKGLMNLLDFWACWCFLLWPLYAIIIMGIQSYVNVDISKRPDPKICSMLMKKQHDDIWRHLGMWLLWMFDQPRLLWLLWVLHS